MDLLFIFLLLIVIVIMFIIYLIKPRKKRMVNRSVHFYAHRGFHNDIVPENSLAAFKIAQEKGFGVELDVQLTKDNKVIVFHDADLLRMCGHDTKINDLTYDELKKYKLKDSSETIPLFSQVLEVMKDMPVICEIKTHLKEKSNELCLCVSDEIAGYKGFVCIESFSPFVLRWFKKNKPEIIRGQLSMDFIKKREGLRFIEAFMMKNLFVNVWSRPDFIAYSHTDDSPGFYLCRKLFDPVCIGWTVKSKKDIKKAENKYYSFIFENIFLN